MSNNSTIKLTSTTSTLWNVSSHLIELDFSSNVRLIRRLFHVLILISFTTILAFISRKRLYSQLINRPLSSVSHFIVSIGIVGLVLDDCLVINGVIHQRWCSIHQLFLHLLLTIVIVGRLLSDFYEYADRYYQYHDFSTLKSGVLTSFLVLLCVQLFISLRWLWNKSDLSHNEWNPPILCTGDVRPQLFIFILHLLELIFTIQSIREPLMFDDNHSISSINLYLHEMICQLNSILLRLFYFTGTSILHILFLPGQFSASFYGGILVIEFVMKYFANIYHSNTRSDRNLGNIDNTTGMLHTSSLHMKTDDLTDDTRLLNDID